MKELLSFNVSSSESSNPNTSGIPGISGTQLLPLKSSSAIPDLFTIFSNHPGIFLEVSELKKDESIITSPSEVIEITSSLLLFVSDGCVLIVKLST